MNSNFKLDSISDAINDIKLGKIIIVVDDENRENEGDFICAAEMVTPDLVNFMITHGRGLVCVPLTENTRLNSKIEYANNDISCGSGFSATGYEPDQCSTSSNDEVKLSFNWSENTLNDYMYPTEGSSNALGVGIALPLGDYRYFNINANHTSYQPISNDLTLKLTADLGLSKGYSGNTLPFFKRYFGGGN